MTLSSILPSAAIRLKRHPRSPHQDEPRLLKVTLRSEQDLEDVLLHSHLLRNDPASVIRVHADIPWWERKSASSSRAQVAARSLIVLGVPEDTEHTIPHRQTDHDRKQWKFICDIVDGRGTVVTDTFRIPKSVRYKGEGPRPLKLTFLTSSMTDFIRSQWTKHKHKIPGDVRLSVRTSNTTNPTGILPTSQIPTAIVQQNNTPTASKNGDRPAHAESDQ